MTFRGQMHDHIRVKPSDKVSLDERRRTIHRGINMTFRGQMHDHIRVKPSDKVANCVGAGDIRPSKATAWMILYGRQRVEITRVGQLVDDKNILSVAEITCRTKAEPINPAPPVIRYRFVIFALSKQKGFRKLANRGSLVSFSDKITSRAQLAAQLRTGSSHSGAKICIHLVRHISIGREAEKIRAQTCVDEKLVPFSAVKVVPHHDRKLVSHAANLLQHPKPLPLTTRTSSLACGCGGS